MKPRVCIKAESVADEVNILVPRDVSVLPGDSKQISKLFSVINV